MGQPIALFLFTETTTTAPPGPATAVLDVRVQNVSTCKVSFPYTITFTPRQPGQPVNKELHGTVTNLPVNMVVEAHNKVAALPFNLRTANIVITPHGEPQRADCASLEGNWAGAYTMSSENLYNMDFGVVTHEETGNVYVTVPAVGGPVEIRYVQIAGSRPLRDVSTSLVGTLSPDYEFNGQGLVRSSSDHVVDTVRAAGLLRVLADPVSGKPNISVGLRLKYAKTYADIMFLSSNVKLQ